jgi:hypothetical protein
MQFWYEEISHRNKDRHDDDICMVEIFIGQNDEFDAGNKTHFHLIRQSFTYIHVHFITSLHK